MGFKTNLQLAGDEMKQNPPSILAKTAEKYGPERAKKQRIAILLSKARVMGKALPRKRI